MLENSSTGLYLLPAATAVTVTREEHHQRALARYRVRPGQSRQVAVELGWCTIQTGKYQGKRAIEVRLDGQRVGELTHAMTQRYTPFVEAVTAHRARPGCAATIESGPRGLQLELHLPHATDPLPSFVNAPTIPTQQLPRPYLTAVSQPIPAKQARTGPFATHRPLWIGAATFFGVIVVVAAVNGPSDDAPASKPADFSVSATTTTSTDPPPPTTTTPPPVTTTTTTTTTTTKAPQPPPPVTTTTKRPRPTTTTEKPAPAPSCDPNYSGCVPIASDVDCAGGSGDGPAYVEGPIRVIGKDIYRLDRDGDGIACE